MYIKCEYKAGPFTVMRIVCPDGPFFDVIPELGAMVYRIVLEDQKGDLIDVLRYDDPRELSENPLYRGRLLFPFNDRIPEGRFQFEGCQYQLPINEESDGSAIHGLVYNQNFKVQNLILSENKAAVTLYYSIDPDDWSFYPFGLDFSVTYSLSEKGFSVHFSFINHGDNTLPVALGWHPYFQLEDSVDLWRLKSGGSRYVAVDENLNPRGNFLPVEGTDFDFRSSNIINDKELDIALVRSPDGINFLESKERRLELYFDRNLFPFVQLFIPPERDSVAIEPITGATNSFNLDGMGRIELEPGEKREGVVKIALD